MWPAYELQKRGHDVTVELPGPKARISATIHDGNVVDVHYPEDADVLVFQRITHSYLANAIPLIVSRGVGVVVDMDDDLSRIHPKNPAFLMMHPSMGQENHSWNNAVNACRHACVVTTSTAALCKTYASHGRGVVLHNCVPERYLDIEHNDNETIGYAGALSTHHNDVPMLGWSIANLMRDGHTFVTVGATGGIKEMLALPSDPVSLGPVGLHDWPTILSSFGVGVAPLADTKFNAAKSWLKPLEMAAVGVPCVMSPRDEYARIHKLGVGLLAKEPRQWYSILSRLLRDPIERQELAERSRAAVDQITIENHADRWLAAWELAGRIAQDDPTAASAIRSGELAPLW